jgi:pimeloyl-ACP methyl ester carboxylesterase
MVDIAAAAVAAGAPPERLPRNSVYRTLTGRADVQAFYDRVLARLPYPVESRYVATQFGRTHLTIGGNRNGTPLVILPGMSIGGPLMMEFFASCARKRLLIALDLIGHPGRSEDRVHPNHDHGFGRWLAEVLDTLKIERADIVSASFGSSVALDLAVIAPRRVGKLALVMPAGLTPRLPYLRLYLRFLVPWITYRYFPSSGALPAITRPLGDSFTADDFRYFDLIVRETTFWRHRPAGPFFAKDLADYREPVFLVTAGRDELLPPKPTRRNAAAALRIAQEIHLADSTHMPSGAAMADVHERIADYFD